MTVTAVDLDEFARVHSKDECPLDRYDRYLIVPDGADKAIPHTRASTVSKTMDDGYGLVPWKVRNTALGFAVDQILFGRLCALAPEDLADVDDHKLDALCGEALKAAGGEDARDTGTLLHDFAEQTVKGIKPVDKVPDPYRADIVAAHHKLDELGIRIVPEFVERYVVVPGLTEPVAGRIDGPAWFGSTLKVFDWKTGVRLGPWSWLAFAIQLALYSRAASFYNAKTKTHEPVPAIDQDTGLIFHMPAGKAKCDVYFVDLNLGWQAAQVAMAVRGWRRRGKSGELAEPWHPDEPVQNVDVRRARLLQRAQEVAALDGGRARLAAAWPVDVPTFKQAPIHTAGQLDQIAYALSAVEADLRAPFGAPDPSDLKTKETT